MKPPSVAVLYWGDYAVDVKLFTYVLTGIEQFLKGFTTM